MGEPPDSLSHAGEAGPAPESDLTGRDRMARNVVAGWISHFVFLAGGLILPRLIDRTLSQDALGVWDFGWSLIAYMTLVQLGITTSVSRYVAKCRSVGDADGVNSVVSSVSCVFLIMAAAALLSTVAAALVVPRLLSQQLAGHVSEARWIVVFFGMALTVQIASSGIGGVVTGCHRWDLQSAIYAGSHVVTIAAIAAVLFLGGGLAGAALAHLGGEILNRSVRVVAAYKVYPQLRIRFGYARWSVARSMLTFGGKSFLPNIAELMLNQTISIVVFACLGPGMLAVYTRPKSLLRHATRFVAKFANVLVPTAGSLQAMKKQEDLRELLVMATRNGAFIALPMVLGMLALGSPFLRIWMGPAYDRPWLIAVLAAGSLASLIHLPTLSVMSGMNLHGRPGIGKVVAAVCTVGAGLLVVWRLQWGLLGAAMAVVVPLTLVDGIYLPVYACQQLRMPFRRYLIESFRKPLLCTIPFTLCLVAARVAFLGRPGLALLSGALAGTLALAVPYWRSALPASLKRRIARRVGLAPAS